MEPWMWIVAVVVLLVVGGWASRSMRPRMPESPASSAAPATTSATAPPALALDAAERAEIEALIADGTPIAAIKRLRELQPMSLQEAKRAIDAWVPGRTADADAPPRTAPTGLSVEATAEIDQLVAERRAIEAIKTYRAATGVGLAEAKRAVEAWPGYRPPPGS